MCIRDSYHLLGLISYLTAGEPEVRDVYKRQGDGLLAVEELQIPGKKRMETSAFLRGYTFEEGTVLTDGSKE